MLHRLLNVMTASNSTEPPSCWAPFSTEAGGLHYSWRGWGPRKKSTTIGVFDSFAEQWSLKPTTGPTPPGVYGGGCVCVGDCLYTFGGNDGFSWLNDVHKLDINTCQWSKVEPSGSLPMKKNSCGLLHIDDNTLCCFGGWGIGPTQQPGATFTRDTGYSDGRGWTNELHFFNTQNGVWSSPDIRGERPPPCAYFSFTKVDQHRAALFGGRQPDARVNNIHLLNLRSMEFTKMKPVPVEPCPVGRSYHAACCLNYSEEHPQLLVSGGVDDDNKVLMDMWILDIDTGKWTEVTPPESHKPRCRHSTTATSLGPGLAEVLMFGGCHMRPKNLRSYHDYVPVAETTLLRFEWTGPSQSVAGPSTGKWALVDVAHNNTRGSSQRLREKIVKIRQAAIYSSSVRDWVRDLEQQLQVTQNQKEKELAEANHHCKEQLQEKDQQLAVAEQRAQLAEERVQVLQSELNDRTQELEVTRRKAVVEQRAQLTEQALRSELEGKSRELVAHNTEVWRIPSTRVSTVRTIGTGGWGEVLEGTVRVAMKRLHPAIVNQHNLERLQREMRLLAEVRHPNLVQFIGAVFDQSPPLIITELLDMNLRQAYEQNQLRAGDRLSIFIDTARALDYLHQRYKPIIHRDVSSPNILLQQMPNNQWRGKLSDLGSANFLQQAQTMGEGAIVYSPPEVIPRPFVRAPPQTGKIDVYSFGIVMAEVTASRFPSQENFTAMFEFVQRERPQVYDLIVHCTKRDPSDRPSMAEVLVELGRMDPL